MQRIRVNKPDVLPAPDFQISAVSDFWSRCIGTVGFPGSDLSSVFSPPRAAYSFLHCFFSTNPWHLTPNTCSIDLNFQQMYTRRVTER